MNSEIKLKSRENVNAIEYEKVADFEVNNKQQLTLLKY
jgi:hypothetical protein